MMSSPSTKERIADEFYALTQTKNLDKISVKDIVEACDISRQTFYYHFRDIPDLLEWQTEKLVNQTINNSLNEELLVDALEKFITQFKEYSSLVQRVIHSNRRYEFQQIFISAFRRLVEHFLKHRLANRPIPLQDFELIVNYHTYGLVGILISRANQPNFSARQLALQLNRMIQAAEENLKPTTQ